MRSRTLKTKRHGHRGRGLSVILLLALVLGGGLGGARPAAATGGAPRYFAATGLTMAGEFTPYFDEHGGLPVFGYPISEATEENGFLVQYFERERLEYHPEHAGTPFEVLLGLLGVELTAGRATDPAFQPAPAPPASIGRRYFPETRHMLGGLFADYWASYGGLSLFGYPISEEFTENGVLTQWFERARFEYHPENQPPYNVLLGLLGREISSAGGGEVVDAAFTVADGPTQDRHLVLGLAQGGESRDPDFLRNVVGLAQPLRVPLIRLDNIFTHYDVVERAPDGRLVYHFDKLERAVDAVRAIGAEPYLCLGYMPDALAPGTTGIDPPESYAEWRDLVFETVKHFNVDRGPPIKYWEVWNEPNLTYSWTGGYPGYLDLYDSSRAGLQAADPTAWIGGPTITPLDVTAPAWLMGHERQQGSAGRVDFLSWHSFGRTIAQIEADVKAVQGAVAAQTAYQPELIISEFSVATGGAGDTSQGHRSDGSGAGAYALAGFQAMERAGLDKGFMFELKDGEKPGESYWGRWGILTADGQAKPAYYALLAYQQMATGQLPVTLTTPPGTGVELLAARGSDGTTRLLLWHAGVVTHRAQITLPPALAALSYRVTVFDSTHNNFAAQGDDRLTTNPARRGTQLDFTLEPDSFVVLESP